MRDKRKKGIRRDMSINTIVGVDLGDSASLATVLSSSGEIKDRFPFQMDEQWYALFSDRVPWDARLAFEATTMAYPFSRTLRELGYGDITVAHPVELAWIVRSKKKNDKTDSLKIAKLCRFVEMTRFQETYSSRGSSLASRLEG